MKILKNILIFTLLNLPSLTLCMDKDFTHGYYDKRQIFDGQAAADNAAIEKKHVKMVISDEQRKHMNTFYQECKDHLDTWYEKDDNAQIKILYSILNTKNRLQNIQNPITMPMMSCFAYTYKKPFSHCFSDTFTESPAEPFHLTLFFEQLRKYDKDLFKKQLRTPTTDEFNAHRKNLSAQKIEEKKQQYAKSINISFYKSLVLLNIPYDVAAERFRTLLMDIGTMLQSDDDQAQMAAQDVYNINRTMINAPQESDSNNSNNSLYDDNFLVIT